MKRRTPAATVQSGPGVEVDFRMEIQAQWTIVLTCGLVANDSLDGSGLESLRILEAKIIPGEGK